jgi:ubiquinone/menaquinone biosynthesis C-methylase UbiE
MSNADQIEYWNGEAGANWVEQADALDLMLHDVGQAVFARAALSSGNRVLDVGCGSGALTLACQDQVGDTGQAIGLDISQPLIRNAQRRATERKSRAIFIEGDAATWRGVVGIDVSADVVVSRFGVMFFDDPTAAFANILQLTKPGGHLHFACWRSPKENDMGSGLMKAAAPLFVMPDTKPEPTAPGPFAFADQAYVSGLLASAGWRDVAFEPRDGRLPLAGTTARENAVFLAQMGPIGRLMREQHVALDRVVDALVPFLEQRHENGKYALNGAIWLASARR